MKFKTTDGLTVAWLTKYSGEGGFYGFSGRVRVVLGDPSQDEVVRWDAQDKAVNHSFGDLIRANHIGSYQLVQGKSIFGRA